MQRWIERLLRIRRRPEPETALRLLRTPSSLASVAQHRRRAQDDALRMTLNFLAEALLGAGWRVETDESRYVELAQRAFTAPGFAVALRSMVAAQIERYAVIEIVWGRDFVPIAYRTFTPQEAALEFDPYGEVARIQISTVEGLQELPLERAIVYRYQPDLSNPAGRTRLEELAPLLDAKARVDDALVRIVERYSAPPLIGYHLPNLPAATVDALEQALRDLRSGAGALIGGVKGEQVSIETLDVKVDGYAPDLAMRLLENYERRIARLLLGSVLALFEAQYGTRAQAEVHASITRQILRGYQQDLEECIHEQLWTPLCYYQFGVLEPPRWQLNEPTIVQPDRAARWLSELIAVGVLDPETDRETIRQLFDLPSV